MAEGTRDFNELMLRVQQGSDGASRELLSRYGPHIKRVVRHKLHKKLRAKFDSDDFTQAVWASFFAVDPAARCFDRPETLIAYLANAAQNKVIETYRQRLHTQKYNVTREWSLDAPGAKDAADQAASQPTPSQYVMADEEWERLLRNQPAHFRRILTLVRQGHTHEDIAKMVGVNCKTIQRLLRKLHPGLGL